MIGIANYYKESIRKYKAGNNNKHACVPIGMTKTTHDPIFIPQGMDSKDRNSVITVRIDSRTIRRRPYRPIPFTTC